MGIELNDYNQGTIGNYCYLCFLTKIRVYSAKQVGTTNTDCVPLSNWVDYNSTFPNLFATFLYMSTSCFDNGLIFFMALSKCFIFIFKSFACFSASLESGYLVICSLNANMTAADDNEAISAPVYPSVLSAKSSILNLQLAVSFLYES